MEYNQFYSQSIDIPQNQVPKVVQIITSSSKSGEAIGNIRLGKNNTLIATLGSWTFIDGSRLSYVDANTAQVNGVSVNDVFELGMRVKLSQSGATKYFVITNLDSTNNRVRLTAGNDYSLSNVPFENIQISTSRQPSGFPDTFAFSSTLVAQSPLTVSASGSFTGNFRMDGIETTVYMSRAASTMGGTAGLAYETLPLEAQNNTGYIDAYLPSVTLTASSTTSCGFYRIDGTNRSRVYINYDNLGSLPTGTLVHSGVFRYLYSHD